MLNYLLVIFTYLAVANATAYFLMYKDKQYAIQGQWRIAQGWLLLCCFVGGFIGTHLAMQHFRHKTTLLVFKSAVMFSGIIWIVLLPILFFWLFMRSFRA
ncbi:DUF1294 domain-containing protein [Pasteurella sp. P03HT]